MLTLIKQTLKNDFVRFLLTGAINTAFGYVLFIVVLFFLKNVYWSILLSTIIAVLFNFKTYGTIVFKSKSNHLIFRFFAVYGFGMILQMLLFKLFAHFGLTNGYIVGAILLLPMTLLSFLLMKKFVF